jgi:hypothetical protein
LSVFPCRFHSIGAPLIVKTGKKTAHPSSLGLHKKPQGCGARLFITNGKKSFPWPPLEAEQSIFNVSVFCYRTIHFEK